MMRVILLLYAFYDRIDTVHRCYSSHIFLATITPPTLWEFFSLIESILDIDIVIVGEIELSHILTPAEDLSEKSFLRREGHMPAEDSIEDFLWMEESEIHRRRDI